MVKRRFCDRGLRRGSLAGSADVRRLHGRLVTILDDRRNGLTVQQARVAAARLTP
jgi:hypothetical protein